MKTMVQWFAIQLAVAAGMLCLLAGTVHGAAFWGLGLQPRPWNLTVCFVGNGRTNDPARAAQIIEYMKEFEYAGNIHFNYLGDCPAAEPLPSDPNKEYYGGDLRILIPACTDVQATGQVPGVGCPLTPPNDNLGWGSWANPPSDLELRRSCAYNVKLGDDPWSDTEEPYLDHTLHEIGHAMGFVHEHVRIDYDPVCAAQVNNDPACYNSTNPDVQACLAGSAPADYHFCCGYGGDWNSGLMTPYDRLSVMHYQFLACGIAGNYDRDGFSEWDKLALHIMYPEDNRVAEFVGKTVIRAGEMLSLQSLWYNKGAYTSNVAGNFLWKINGVAYSTAPFINKTMSTPGVYTLEFSHDDHLTGIPARHYSYTGKIYVLEDADYDELMGAIAAQNQLLASIQDLEPPSPNPMTWAVGPFEQNTSSISMSASEAFDNTQPVQYYFDFYTSPTGGSGGTDSGWQASRFYQDSNLQANHNYGYRVKARDSASPPNETSYSTIVYDYTDIETPIGLIFTDAGSDYLELQSRNTPSGLDRGSSGLFIDCANGVNSGWKQDNLPWRLGGLAPNTNYQCRVQARNGDGDKTVFTGYYDRYTKANPPGSGFFTEVTANSIRVNWSANGNPARTEYACQNMTAGTGSGWITDTSWNDTGLTCGTPYTYRVMARNTTGTTTNYTSLGEQTTVACPPICPGDRDNDDDVDGHDLADYIETGDFSDITGFAGAFGNVCR